MTVIVDKKLLVDLRKKTYAGFSDCKKALEATNNDLEEAIVWLRKNGIAKASSKFADKDAGEGKVFAQKNTSGAAIIELNSETDFTANAEPFIKLGTEICQQVLDSKCCDLKDAESIVLKNGQKVSDEVLSLSSITGEKISLKKISYIAKEAGTSIASYQHHTGKIGSVIKFTTELTDEQIHGLAVHLAANSPKFLTLDQVDAEWKEKEKSIIEELMKNDPKVKDFYEKILGKKLEKVVSENCFLTQAYLFDGKKTVQNILEDLKTTIHTALRYEIGQA